jgi:membrane protease YdiL (CAAX protease family)
VQRNIDPHHVTPASLLGTNLGLASMILATWFIVRVVHRLRPRWLASVMPGLRWRFLLACLGLAVVALGAQLLVGTAVPGSADDLGGGHLNHFTGTTAAGLAVVLLTTPLQAAGEEYLFRGYLLQAICSLVPRDWFKWVGIAVSAGLFALAHGGQNPPLFFDRLAFGLIAAWLVTRTGGLEAGIALHVLNNFLAFGAALAFGNLTSTLTVSHVSWWNIVSTVTQSGVYTLLVVLLARRWHLQNRTWPPYVEPGARPGAAAATA